jgi:hypothetical protein
MHCHRVVSWIKGYQILERAEIKVEYIVFKHYIKTHGHIEQDGNKIC